MRVGMTQDASGHLDDFLVAHPVGRWKDDLVPWVDQGEHHIGQALLGPGAYHDLIGRVLESVVSLKFLDDRVAHMGCARHWRIVGVVRVNGVDARLLHLRWRIEIRLPKGERNDVDALVLQLTGFAGHGNGCGFAKTLKEGGCGLFHVG